MIGDAGVAPFVFSVAFMGLLLSPCYTIQVDELMGERERCWCERKRRTHHRHGRWRYLAIVGRALLMLSRRARALLVIGSVCWLVFFAFVTWSELRSLLRQREVTGETISMSVSVYLLIGLTWGILYIVLYESQPEAFNLGALRPPPRIWRPASAPLPDLIYFSLTTLSTIGFGDITPLTLQARYAAVAEGITGQFYLAILVARLVGMQMSNPDPQHSHGADD